MCKAFSCIVKHDGAVLWKAGVDSHEDILRLNGLRDTCDERERMPFAKVEITPNNRHKYPYLWPEKPWKLHIDERITPAWWGIADEANAMAAFEQWKQAIYTFDYKAARQPINPLKLAARTPTTEDIALLRRFASVGDSVWNSVWNSVRDSVRDSVWNSVWNSVRNSVWTSVGNSVRDSVWDSVWASIGNSVWDSIGAYIGSMFPGSTCWKYAPPGIEGYPYQPAVDLWKRGLVASFDGKVWRLHSGPKATVVWQGSFK